VKRDQKQKQKKAEKEAYVEIRTPQEIAEAKNAKEAKTAQRKEKRDNDLKEVYQTVAKFQNKA